MTKVIDSTKPTIDAFAKPYRYEICSPEEAQKLAQNLTQRPDQAAEILGASETQLASGFRAPKRLGDWLAGRIAAKRLLTWVLQQEGRYLKPNQIEILPRPDGSPSIRATDGDALEPYHLSLSHAAGWGVAAIGRPGSRVGIDIETVEPREASFLQVMAHDSEWDETMNVDPVEQTRLWTLKEAVAKLIGTGLSVGFHDIRFPLTGDARRLELHGKALEAYQELGAPTIHFDSETRGDQVLSIAYTVPGGHHG